MSQNFKKYQGSNKLYLDYYEGFVQITGRAVAMSVTIDSIFSSTVKHLKPEFQTIVLALSLF